MNPHPKYTPAHMRAKIAGLSFAECTNCKYFNHIDISARWCEKNKTDPNPTEPLYTKTLCELYEPAS